MDNCNTPQIALRWHSNNFLHFQKCIVPLLRRSTNQVNRTFVKILLTFINCQKNAYEQFGLGLHKNNFSISFKFCQIGSTFIKAMEKGIISTITVPTKKLDTIAISIRHYVKIPYYEESVVDKFKSNLLLLIFWLNIINYNS